MSLFEYRCGSVCMCMCACTCVCARARVCLCMCMCVCFVCFQNQVDISLKKTNDLKESIGQDIELFLNNRLFVLRNIIFSMKNGFLTWVKYQTVLVMSLFS